MPSNATLNSWGDPVKTTSSTGEPVWGDAEASSQTDQGSRSSSSGSGRPGFYTSQQQNGDKNGNNGPMVRMTEEEEQIFRKALVTRATADVVGSLAGGYVAWRYVSSRPTPPNRFAKFFAASIGAFIGGQIAMIPGGMMAKSVLSQVSDRQHFKQAMDSKMKVARMDMEAKKEQMKQRMGQAPPPKIDEQSDRTPFERNIPGNTPAEQPDSSQAGNPRFGSRPMNPSEQQNSNQASSQSSSSRSDDPFGTPGQESTSTVEAASGRSASGSKWAQIRGEANKPVSSWDRLRGNE
ncbi:unnamed protein product [Sympodiomycopsis kandeliae]